MIPETAAPIRRPTGRAVLHPMVLVDECMRIDLRELGLFKHPLYSTWTITKVPIRVSCHISRDAEGSPIFCIANDSWEPGSPFVQEALLEPTRCAVRGQQWWFRCPRVVDGLECGRRCRVLYCPRGESEVGCLRCYRLTYRSRQQHRSLFYETIRVLDTVPRILADLHARWGSRRRFRALCRVDRELARLRRQLNRLRLARRNERGQTDG